MRISINSHYLRRERLSGLGRYTHQIIGSLVDQGIQIIPIGVPKHFYSNGIVAYKYVRFFLISAVELLLPPLIRLTGQIQLHISPAFSAPAGFWSKKYIVVVHDLAFIEYRQFYSALENLYFRINLWILSHSCQRIVVPSEYVKRCLCEHFKIKLSRVTVIPPYADLRNESWCGTEQKSLVTDRYFLLLSNAHPRKNISATVEGFIKSRAPSAGYRLRIVGNFEASINYCSPHIDIIQGLSDQELACLMRAADALVLFSLSEGFGFPVVEAAQFGVSALTSEVSSLAELISPERAASPACTVDEIARKIDDFIFDDTIRAQMAEDVNYINKTFNKARFEQLWRDLIHAE